MHAGEREILRLYEMFDNQISAHHVFSYSRAPYLYHCEEKWPSTKQLKIAYFYIYVWIRH